MPTTRKQDSSDFASIHGRQLSPPPRTAKLEKRRAEAPGPADSVQPSTVNQQLKRMKIRSMNPLISSLFTDSSVQAKRPKSEPPATAAPQSNRRKRRQRRALFFRPKIAFAAFCSPLSFAPWRGQSVPRQTGATRTSRQPKAVMR